jgi:hypothetical protein
MMREELQEIDNLLEVIERYAVFYMKTGIENYFEEIQKAKHDVLAEVRRLKEIELLHNGLSEHLTRVEQENELLKATSPLMTTTPLEIEIKRYKQALEEIVKRIMWGDSVHACIDCNLIAQKALKGEGQ